MNVTEILVIILSILLAVFLLFGIVLAVLLIKVTIQIKKVTTTAGKAANNMENLSAYFSKLTSTAFVGSFLMSQLKKIRTKK